MVDQRLGRLNLKPGIYQKPQQKRREDGKNVPWKIQIPIKVSRFFLCLMQMINSNICLFSMLYLQ